MTLERLIGRSVWVFVVDEHDYAVYASLDACLAEGSHNRAVTREPLLLYGATWHYSPRRPGVRDVWARVGGMLGGVGAPRPAGDIVLWDRELGPVVDGAPLGDRSWLWLGPRPGACIGVAAPRG